MGVRGRLRGLLARLAAGAPARVYPLVGAGGREAAEDLALDPRLRFVDSPRSADVLLAVGGAAAGLLRPALGVHDQVSHPRSTVWWPVGEDDTRRRRLAERFHRMVVVGEDDDPVEVVVGCHRELFCSARDSDPEVLRRRSAWEAAEWRGVGPHGQGGEGMMGGTPYGRPMAMRAPDRDGLELDRLPFRLGPFFPHLPPGLTLEVELQGDVFQRVAVGRSPFARWARHRALQTTAPSLDPFAEVLHRPVAVADLEVARGRHHLRWLAQALRFHGLPALGERALRLALRLGPATAGSEGDAVRRLERLLRRTGTLRAATRGVGRVRRGEVTGLGPAARAAGRAEDLRSEVAAYRDLGFSPVVGDGGDAWSRLVQRLRETAQALEIAGRAGDLRIGPLAAVEAPRGVVAPGEDPPAARLLALVPELLAGSEWGDGLAALVSLDLDLEAAAPPPRVSVAPLPASAADPVAGGAEPEPAEEDGDEDDEEAAA